MNFKTVAQITLVLLAIGYLVLAFLNSKNEIRFEGCLTRSAIFVSAALVLTAL